MNQDVRRLSVLDMALIGAALCVGTFALLAMNQPVELESRERSMRIIGRVIEFSSDVRHRLPNSIGWTPVRTGDELIQGESIFTGENSRARLLLTDKSIVEIDPKSLLVLDTISGNINVDIQRGAANLTLSKGAGISVTRKGRTVDLSQAKSNERIEIHEEPEPAVIRDLAASDSFGLPPKIRIPLHFKVAMNWTESLQTEKPVVIHWETQSLNTGYELQVSRDKEFRSPESFFTANDFLEVHVLPETQYYVRVRGVRSFDVPSTEFSAVAALTLSAELLIPAPQLTEPNDKSSITFFGNQKQEVFFRWLPIENAEQYELQVSPERMDMTNEAVQFQKLTSTEPNILWSSSENHSQIWWRVRAKVGRRFSEWSVPRTLHLSLVP